jgi:hypothetical protein
MYARVCVCVCGASILALQGQFAKDCFNSYYRIRYWKWML